jgi:acyl-CoA thioester hydrolase
MSLAKPASFPLSLYRGCVNAWECDEMGHMNVRFYVQRAMEGVALFAADVGLKQAFQHSAASILTPRFQHIRFLKEARAGAELDMVAGVLGYDESAVTLYQELRHASGDPAAAFTTLYAHTDAKTGRNFRWPDRALAALAVLGCELPAHGAPRSIDTQKAPGPATIAMADQLGVKIIGRGAVQPTECDVFGRARAELFIGRVSDSMPNLLGQWRRDIAKSLDTAGGGGASAGAAVLEYRVAFRRWPRTGDLLQMRSGVVAANEKSHRVVHWVLDPVSGEAWATAEAVAVTFDLNTRKTISLPQAQLSALQDMIIPGLAI